MAKPVVCVAQIVTGAPVQVVAAVFDIQMLEEYPIEGVPKLTVVDAVDDWIEC